MKSPKRSSMAFWLSTLPGILGVFVLGHLYWGKKERELAFLAYSAMLLALLLTSILVPTTSAMLWMPSFR
jgi:hypothetical protein